MKKPSTNDEPTHPLKELEILLNAGVYHLDSQEDGGTDNACHCLREAADTLNAYFEALGFDHSGRPPAELAEAERRIIIRLKQTQGGNKGHELG